MQSAQTKFSSSTINLGKTTKYRNNARVEGHEKCPTFEAFFTMGFPEELFAQSSIGGGSTFPDRRCKLYAAPVIC